MSIKNFRNSLCLRLGVRPRVIRAARATPLELQRHGIDPTGAVRMAARKTAEHQPAAAHETVLFNRFQRGGEQSGLTSKERGVGLGLAIAKQLVEGFGGRINVQSEVNVGSTFSIEIPAVSEEQLHSNEYGVVAAA